MEIKSHEQGIGVLKAFSGGPADKGGVQRGDIITSVDGQALAGRSLDYAVDLISGQAGTPVLLTIVRDGRRSSGGPCSRPTDRPSPKRGCWPSG